jgi:hypothetical protein
MLDELGTVAMKDIAVAEITGGDWNLWVAQQLSCPVMDRSIEIAMGLSSHEGDWTSTSLLVE